jgi:UDP-N-acetyl-D-mannosaminuronic acid dehydrogenase
VDSAPDEAKLIHAARLVNDGKPNFVLEKINQAVEAIGKTKSELSIACFGLAFKPDIDDLRESPALAIAQQVVVMGFYAHYLVEPNISELPDGFDSEKVKLVDLESALTKADVVLLLVDHAPFKELELGMLSGKQVVDTRGIWSKC